MDTMGRRIKAAAKDCEIRSMAELARRIGVHSSTTSDWSRDKRKPPIDQLRAIAEATGKPLWFFLEGLRVNGGEDGDYQEQTILGLADIMGRQEALALLAAALPGVVEAKARRKQADAARHAPN
jgi:transcriptional regulator with XRE-family HTH domain